LKRISDNRRALAGAALGISVFILGCQDVPQFLVDKAASALAEAEQARAVRYAESEYDKAAELLRAGRLEIARQSGRLAFLRDYDAADSILISALRAARQAQLEAQKRENELRSQAENERASLVGELDTWRSSLDGSLTLFRAERVWAEARLALLMSEKLMASGEYQTVIETAIHGKNLIHELNRILTDYANHEAQMAGVWRTWVRRTVEQSREQGTSAIVVDKAAHTLYLVRAGQLVKSYSCDLGYNSAGHKFFAGDGATPEGEYRITTVKNNGSKYYKALLIDYPNERDKRRFRENKAKGIISQRARIGALIEIHGDGGRNTDWTEGCVALTNKDMDHLMQHVQKGTPVTIVRRSDSWP